MTASLADNFRFLKALITRPKLVGAVIPSSPALARAMARQIDPAAGPVLEVGPGTGVISEAILERGVTPGRLTLVEYDEELARHLAVRFPRVQVIQGDAFDLDHTLRSHGGFYGSSSGSCCYFVFTSRCYSSVGCGESAELYFVCVVEI